MSWMDTLEQIRTKDFSQATSKQRERAARDVVNMCSYASALVSVTPVPFSDALLTIPIQSGMVMTVGHIYGRKLGKTDASNLLMELGAAAGMSFLARQGVKALLPFLGAILTIPAAFAASWAIGRAAMHYFEHPQATRDELDEVFQRAKKEASQIFSKDAFDRFRRGNEDAVRDEVERAKQTEHEAETELELALEGAKKKKKAPEPAARKKPEAKRAAPAKKTIGKKKPAKKTGLAALIEDELPNRLDQNRASATELGGLVHLDVSGDGGGSWTVDLTGKGQWVKKGHAGTPKLKVTVDSTTLDDLLAGRTSPEMAVFGGRLAFDPFDLDLARQFGAVLR